MDFDLEMLKREVADVKKRIEGLKAVRDKPEFLSIPTTYVNNAAPGMVVNINLRLREVSQSLAHLGHYQKESLLFDSDALMLFAPDSREAVKSAVKKIEATEFVAPFEVELLGTDGLARPAILAALRIGPTENDIYFFFLDISAQKNLQKELAIRQSNLTTLAEAIPQLIWVTDSRGEVSYANEQFRQYSGISDLADIDWRKMLDASERKLFSQEAFGQEEMAVDFESEVRLLRKSDGASLWHQIKIVPFFNGEGIATHWLIIATEIDDQKRLAESLVVAEEQLRVIADAMPQIVWTANARGTVDFLNHRWFEYTGLTGEQSLHGGWRLLIHTEDLPKYDERWRMAVLEGEPFEVEFRLKRVLGLGSRKNSLSAFKAKTSSSKVEQRRDYLWHLCRAVPLKTSQGLVVRWFGTWTEIDEHKTHS